MWHLWGGEMRVQGFGGKPEGKRQLGRPGVSWRIIIRGIFRKWDVGVWTGLNWLMIERGGGRL
jgi:hypothetical protein